jgi:pilus assembly protein Flp/PilA
MHLQRLPLRPLSQPVRSLFAQLLQDESGQDLIEYALVAALVGLAAVGAMRGLSTKIATSFNSVGNNLTSAI